MNVARVFLAVALLENVNGPARRRTLTPVRETKHGCRSGVP